MSESILIFKRRGKKVTMKVTKKMRSGFVEKDCDRIVNIKNHKDLALWFHDLEDLFGAPVSKAVKQFQEDKKSGTWPF